MSKKRALITGISGMDGSTMAEILLAKDYEVFGIVRRHSVATSQTQRIEKHLGEIKLFYGDLTDKTSLERAVIESDPDEIYNFAAMSQVRNSFDVPIYTVEVDGLGVLNLLEVYKSICPEAKFYQASSSEMFGNNIDEDGFQREDTPMHPVSPYGCAKLLAYSLVRHYRRAYDLFAVNGILFNHTGPRRGETFVEQKIVRAAVDILWGRQDHLVLGNLNAQRDFGHSRDYMDAAYRIMHHNEPDDFVVATGETHTIQHLLDTVFQICHLEPKKYLKYDPKFNRAEELHVLKGDSSKIRNVLGWKPEYTFEEILDEMVSEYQYDTQKNGVFLGK